MRPAVSKAVMYTRVSTRKQRASGLGREAQEALIESYARHYGVEIVARFTDTESGKNDDRPGLEAARLAAIAHGGFIVVATLDRLSRDAAFIANLMKEGTQFTCADMPAASTFELHIRAAIAQEERRKISERTRLALQAAKARGKALGGWRGSIPDATARALSVAAQRRKAERHMLAHIVLIETLRRQGQSWREIAKRFTSEGFTTANGKTVWQGVQVQRIAALRDVA